MTGPDKSIAVQPGELEAQTDSVYPRILYVRCGATCPDGSTPTARPALIEGLAGESWTVGFHEAGAGSSVDWARPALRAIAARVRAKFAFLKHLVRSIPRYDVVHIEASGHATSGTRTIARLALPTLILTKFFGKQAILQFSGAEAETFLDRQGAWFHPVLKAADRIVVGSRYLQKAVGHARLEARRINAAIDTSTVVHRVIRQPQPRILLVSPLERAYNVSCAIRAFGLVKQKYPRAELLIVGEGSRGPALQRLVRDSNLWGIEFLGECSAEQTRALYPDTDLYLHSASVDESPASFIQAFAAGLPIVTTDADGLLHMVRDRHNALIATVGDHVGLADRIIEMIETPDLTEKLSRQGKREADCYAWSRVRQDWVNLYTELVPCSA